MAIFDHMHNERYRWVILGTLFSVHSLTSVGQNSIPPLLPFIKRELELNYTQVGLFTSSYFLGCTLMATLTGWAADYFGVKKAVLLGTLMLGISTLIASRMPSFWWMMVFLLFAGVGYSVMTPATSKATMYWFHERLRATAMGIKQTGINVGGFFAAFMIPPLALNFNWRYAFSIAALVVLMGGIVMLILYREMDPQSYRQSSVREWKNRIGQVIWSRNVLILSLEGFFRVGVQTVLLTYLILYLLKGLQLSVISTSFLFALTHAMGGIGRITWGVMSDRIFRGRRKMVYISIALISGLFLLVFANLTSLTPIWVVIVVVALLGFTAVGFQGVMFSLVVEAVGKELSGVASGFCISFYSLGAVLIVPLFGFTVDFFGNYFYAWVGLALFSFIASGLVFFVREE